MEYQMMFEKIVRQLDIGDLMAEPQRVSGGYMHKMYKLETTKGKYAVKLLNPSIMKRPDAKGNYAKAESLERILESNNIPIVPALEINGTKLQCVDNQYFYIFNWIEGRALDWNEITLEHCKTAGKLLADIHKLHQVEKPNELDEITVDWDGYISLAEEKCHEIVDILKINRSILYSAEKAYNEALKSAPDITCICDGDMDCKNVLWQDGKPVIIDLECLDYGNPFLEMFNLALSWSGGVLCDIDVEKLKAFIAAYKQEYGVCDIDCSVLSGIGFSWLDWLEYNVKRALMIECNDEKERKLGISQVIETVDRIVYYARVREDIVNVMSNSKIRLMTVNDKEAVVNMMRVFYASPAVLSNGSEEIFVNDVENCVNDSPYLEGYIIENSSEIQGYAMVAKSFSTEFGKPCIWIEDLYIKDEYRGRGLGSMALKFIEEKYPNALLRLEVEEENERAVKTYKKCGFEVLSYMEMKK